MSYSSITSSPKRLMLLGGIRYLLPVIETAHELGVHVITADYLPDNIAHRHSDEYVNVSIIDREAVLKVAQERKIDGIMSFGVDPGVVTAAYVAERMGLPFQCSHASAQILQDKGLFRAFLADHGFNTPKARRYEDKAAALADAARPEFPVIVKPVDSAGSKGCRRADDVETLSGAIDEALAASHCHAFLIEDYMTFAGAESDTDMFTIDGRLVVHPYSDQTCDPDTDNPWAPVYVCYPSRTRKEHQERLTADLQRLADLLGLRTGLYNVETAVSADGRPCIMEMSPRGGGGSLSVMQDMAFGTHLIENEIRKAVGLPLVPMGGGEIDGCWCAMIIHVRKGMEGVFRSLGIREDIRADNVKLLDLTVRPGDYVHRHTGSNCSLGDMLLRFDSPEQMSGAIPDTAPWLDIELD